MACLSFLSPPLPRRVVPRWLTHLSSTSLPDPPLQTLMKAPRLSHNWTEGAILNVSLIVHSHSERFCPPSCNTPGLLRLPLVSFFFQGASAWTSHLSPTWTPPGLPAFPLSPSSPAENVSLQQPCKGSTIPINISKMRKVSYRV